MPVKIIIQFFKWLDQYGDGPDVLIDNRNNTYSMQL